MTKPNKSHMMRPYRQLINLPTMCWLGILLIFWTLPVWALKDGEAFTDWTAKCQPQGGTERCILYQIVKGEDDKAMLLVEVGYLPENDRPAAAFTVPLGVILPPGMGLKIDDAEPIGIPYERCTPRGCVAAVPLEQDLIAKLKRGTKLEVIVFNTKGPVAVSQPISLSGFTKGFDALNK